MSSSESLLTLIMLLFLFATPPAGLVLLVVGLRGRRVGDEPRCRRCRYNLTGLTSEICPECGADLKATDATIAGLRKRRTVFLIAGVALLLFGVAGWGIRIYGQANQVDWYRYYPAGMLNTAIADGDSKALDELDRRYFAGELSETAIVSYIRAALEMQGSEQRHPLNDPVMNLFCQMLKDGHVSKEEEQRFFQQLVHITMDVRPRIRHGESLVIRQNLSHRGGLNCNFPAFERNARVMLDERMVGEWTPEMYSGTTIGSGGGSLTRWQDYDPNEIPPGTYVVTRTWETHVYSASGNGSAYIDPNAIEPIAVLPFRCTAPVEILPADAQDLVTMVNREGLQQVFERIITIDFNRIYVYRSSKESEVTINLNVRGGSAGNGEKLPVAVAFDVIVRDGEEEHRLGGVYKAKGLVGNWGVIGNVPALDGDTIDIILRANPEVAKKSVDIYEIWGGELCFEDVRVE